MWLDGQVDANAGKGGEHGDLATDEGELPGWAHGGLLERVVGRQRCHPYTIPCICQDETPDSAAADDLLQGLPEPAELEPVARRLRLVRDGSPTIEQQLRLGAEQQAKQQSRCGKPGRAMQDPADLFVDLNLPTDIRGHGIDGAAQPLILEPEPIEPDDVVDVDPGEPLTAAAQRTADE